MEQNSVHYSMHFSSTPAKLYPFPPRVFLHHLAVSAQIELDAGMLLESWSGPIYMKTMKKVQVIFPFAPSLPPHGFMLLSYDLNSKSIGVLFETWTIDPVLNDKQFSTVECTGMGPGLHICFGRPAGFQCSHIIDSSSLAPLVCSCVLSDQACCDPLHLSPSI